MRAVSSPTLLESLWFNEMGGCRIIVDSNSSLVWDAAKKMAEIETVLCVKNEVFVYKIPARSSNRGYRYSNIFNFHIYWRSSVQRI